MSTNLANLLYLIPIVAFILALRFLSNPAHARRTPLAFPPRAVGQPPPPWVGDLVSRARVNS